MKIPQAIIEIISKEELEILMKFYGTDMYRVYIRKLKEKYIKLHDLLDNEDSF